MLPLLQLAAALNCAALVSAHGPWSRAIGYRHLLGPPPGQSGPPQPLWGGAAKTAGARFTPAGGFDSIYLGHDPITAFIEVSALILLPGGPVPVRSAPWVVISVDGILNNLLDLTDPATLTTLGTTAQEMTGTWTPLPHPPTQRLGQLAYDSGRIVGIKYASAKRPGGINVVVFPDRIHVVASNYLEVYDPHGHLAQRIP
ncbi:MAG: RES family NAD+ phosphorylase [Verrucomicrobiae bacterium]|nr:RES family NAD+ phosphorylase [Verrucomicrobiae bacterium]